MANDGESVSDRRAPGADRVGDLLSRVAQGDRTALARAYDATSAQVFGDLLVAVDDRPRAEGALHDAYLEVWHSAGDYRAEQDGTAWILAVAARIARRTDREAVQAADPVVDAGAPAAPVAPPLTSRSTLLAAVDAEIEAAETPAGPEDEAAPDGPAPRRREKLPPAIDPAPTTNTLQAIERTNWTRGLLLLVAAMIVLVGLGWASVTIHEVATRTPADVALAEIEAAPDNHSASGDLAEGGTVVIRWADSIEGAVVVSDDLERLGGDSTYAAWILADDQVESLGTFDVESDGHTMAQLTGTIETGDVITITIEPGGGSTSDEPSADVVVEIATG